MSWHAIDALEESVDVTRGFLFPVTFGRWFRLAVVVFFLGAPSSFSVPSPPSRGVRLPVESGDLGAVLLVIAVLSLVVSVGIGLINAVMQFVLVSAVHTDSLRLRADVRQWFGSGVRLFLFEIGVVLAVAVPALVVGGLAWAVGLGSSSGSTLVLSALVLLPLFLLVVLVVALLLGFTAEFVVPVMVLEGCGVIDGWRRFWPTLKAEWKQYAVFVLLRAIVGLVIGFFVFLLLAIVALITGAAVLVPGFAASVFVREIGAVVIGLFTLIGGLFMVALALVVRIPVVVYFRCYSLLVLRKTNAAFDLLSR